MILERREHNKCPGCGDDIKDDSKECEKCGEFPEAAYHKGGTAKFVGSIKKSKETQPNQKLTENIGPELRNLIKFENFK